MEDVVSIQSQTNSGEVHLWWKCGLTSIWSDHRAYSAVKQLLLPSVLCQPVLPPQPGKWHYTMVSRQATLFLDRCGWLPLDFPVFSSTPSASRCWLPWLRSACKPSWNKLTPPPSPHTCHRSSHQPAVCLSRFSILSSPDCLLSAISSSTASLPVEFCPCTNLPLYW